MIVRRENRSATTPPASVKTTRAIVNDGEHAAERGGGAVDREHRERQRDRDDRVPGRRRDAAEPEQPEPALPQRA